MNIKTKMDTPKLQIKNLCKTFPMSNSSSLLEVIENLNMEVEEGEFICIIGPSGCGKTTIFNILASIEMPSSGEILLDGKPINRKTGFFGYMLQKDVLLPWRNVLDNILIALEIKGRDKRESYEIAKKYLEEYGLHGFEKFYPNALSEGMRQRVALIRTVICEHEIFLFDEPFSSVDYKIRLLLEQDVYDIMKKGKTVLFVTHDIESAVALGDRIFVLSNIPSHVTAEVNMGLARKNGGPINARCSSEFGSKFSEVLRIYQNENGGN